MNMLFIVLAFVVILFVPSVFAAYYLSTRKTTMQCIAFRSDELFREAQEKLRLAGVDFSLEMSSVTQMAHSSPGITDRAPKELWIPSHFKSFALDLINNSYVTEIASHAIIVMGEKT